MRYWKPYIYTSYDQERRAGEGRTIRMNTVYMGLAQARPNYALCSRSRFRNLLLDEIAVVVAEGDEWCFANFQITA